MTEDGFPPSALGTKEHWDFMYKRELKNYHDFGHEGEVWFGADSMTRVVQWLHKQNIPLTCSIVDIGTGNGMLLVKLAKSGYSNLMGIDYCSDAIALARNLCEREGVSESVNLQVADFLSHFSPPEQFDIGLDKGTFDAVCLDPSNAKEKCLQYRLRLYHILKPNGIFIITSCNWTRDELLKHFGAEFEIIDELPTPSFSFGGHTGHCVTALVFRKRTYPLQVMTFPE